MRKRIFASIASALSILAIGPASAHTSSLGYVPGDTAGSVVFWTGSYEHGGTVYNEGTFTLTGVDTPYNAVVGANIVPTDMKPAGLVDGVNNFFWAQDSSNPSGYDFPVATDPIIFGLGISHWQGISFTGLAPGNYTFTCGTTCGTTQQWESLTSAAVAVTLTTGDIGQPTGAVPEAATWAMFIVGLGAAGTALRGRRRTIVSYA